MMGLSETELLVILGCAVVGWIIVSRIMSHGDQNSSGIDLAQTWHERLAVRADAEAQQIEDAYQQRLRELEDRLPSVPTLPEQSQHNEQKQALLRARDTGLAIARMADNK